LGNLLGIADVGDEEGENLDRPKGIKGLYYRLKGYHEMFERYKG
jgi:hypothetical protein